MKNRLITGILLIILLNMLLFSAGCSDSSTVTTPTSPITTTAPVTSPSSNTSLSVVMTTDKTQYVSGETIKLKITNNLDSPIYYIDYIQEDLVFWDLEIAQDTGWQRLDFRMPMIEGGKEFCVIDLYERPTGAVTELKPHSDLLYEWNQKICYFRTVTELFEPEMIDRDRYRFSLRYSLDKVETEDIETEPWKRPIDLGETKLAYSNEFIIV